MKKTIVLLSLAICALLILSACSSGETESTKEGSSSNRVKGSDPKIEECKDLCEEVTEIIGDYAAPIEECYNDCETTDDVDAYMAQMEKTKTLFS